MEKEYLELIEKIYELCQSAPEVSHATWKLKTMSWIITEIMLMIEARITGLKC